MSESDDDLRMARQVEEARRQFEEAARQLVEANRRARAQGQRITPEMHAAAGRLTKAQEKLQQAEASFGRGKPGPAEPWATGTLL